MITLSKSQIKKLENDYTEMSGVSFSELMERAGSACVDEFCGRYSAYGNKILIICGVGNNGGDGFVIARRLRDKGYAVTVACLGEPKTEIAADNFIRLSDCDVSIICDTDKIIDATACSDYIFDCIFGFGFHGNVDENTAEFIRAINNSPAIKISVDIPSGAECDTARVADECVSADLTLTFTSLKPALISYPAKSYSGEVRVLDIGIDGKLLCNIEPQYICGSEDNIDMSFAKKRNNPTVNKGNFGKALIIAGCYGMCGAAVMATKSAVRSGAGIVTLATVKSNYNAVAASVNECLVIPLDENKCGTVAASNALNIVKQTEKFGAVLFGCGISDNPDRQKILAAVLSGKCNNIVIDADGINALAENINILDGTNKNIVITPHPGEFARLLKTNIPTVQNDRISLAADFAVKHGVTVVLKGAATVVASPDGRVFINTTGNSGMAKGGSGDILAGITVALLAQGMNPFDAASTAVYIHGLAGDTAAEIFGMTAMTPTDTIDCIGKAIQSLL